MNILGVPKYIVNNKQVTLIRACLDGVMRKHTEPGSIWPQPSKPSRFLRQQHLTKEDWMSFEFLVTINSRCTTVELALSVDGLLTNVLAQHLSDTLYIFCGNIYRRFEILQYTIIYENTSINHFLKSDGKYEQRQGWALLFTYNSLLDVRYVIE
jgi:hypothetical protein